MTERLLKRLAFLASAAIIALSAYALAVGISKHGPRPAPAYLMQF